jgi:hypothetical protein
VDILWRNFAHSTNGRIITFLLTICWIIVEQGLASWRETFDGINNGELRLLLLVLLHNFFRLLLLLLLVNGKSQLHHPLPAPIHSLSKDVKGERVSTNSWQKGWHLIVKLRNAGMQSVNHDHLVALSFTRFECDTDACRSFPRQMGIESRHEEQANFKTSNLWRCAYRIAFLPASTSRTFENLQDPIVMKQLAITLQDILDQCPLPRANFLLNWIHLVQLSE